MSSDDKLLEAIERADHHLKTIEQRARDLIVFAYGVEEGGQRVYAQRARDVARDTLRLAGELRAEQSVRVAMQVQRDRLMKRLFPGAAA